MNGVDSQTITNIRAAWTDETERYSIEVYVDNLFDVATYSRANPQRPFLFPVSSRSVLGEPRTLGANFRAKF